jgi:hypothetical protein
VPNLTNLVCDASVKVKKLPSQSFENEYRSE